jgi:hypothetical protein
MTAGTLLARLRRRGVTLKADGTSLHYRAPVGVLSEGDRAAFRAAKSDLLAQLAAEHDPWLAMVLEVFPEATVVASGDPYAARDEAAWRRRYGELPPDFHTLVPAREWLERSKECASLQTRRADPLPRATRRTRSTDTTAARKTEEPRRPRTRVAQQATLTDGTPASSSSRGEVRGSASGRVRVRI